MMGADSSSSGGGGIALTSSNIDKIAVIHDGGKGLLMVSNNDHDDGDGSDFGRESLEQQAIAIGFAGDAADADRLVGTLKTHAQIMELEAGIGNDVTCVFDGRRTRIDSSTTTTTTTSKTKQKLGAVSPAGLDAESIAALSRNEIASRMRSRQPLQLCLLVGGMVRCTNPLMGSSSSSEIEVVDSRVRKQISAGSATFVSSKYNSIDNDENESTTLAIKQPDLFNSATPASLPNNNQQKRTAPINPFLAPKLFWLDQYGSLQNMRYAAHGFGSNFAYSVLDQRYRPNMSRTDAANLVRECFEQLRQRYVINSPCPPRIKCVDALGVTEIMEEEVEDATSR